MFIRPYTDKEFNTVPHIIMTNEIYLDPYIIDESPDNHKDYSYIDRNYDNWMRKSLFYMQGNYKKRVNVSNNLINKKLPCNNVSINKQEPKYDDMITLFSWLPSITIKKTYLNYTQYGKIPHSTILKKHLKSPNPSLNV